jgi:hypothetical protein
VVASFLLVVTLTMVAVMMTATFMVTAFVWQQQPLQQAHALMV